MLVHLIGHGLEHNFEGVLASFSEVYFILVSPLGGFEAELLLGFNALDDVVADTLYSRAHKSCNLGHALDGHKTVLYIAGFLGGIR